MEFDSEVDRRREAVRLVEEGVSKAAAGRRVGRTRQWVSKWLRRYDEHGDAGLEDQSRAPKAQPSKTAPGTVAEILETRSKLEDQPEASIGALSILAQLERDGWPDIPSESTIERILATAGVTRHKYKRDRSTEVHLPLPNVTVPGIWQQADWIQDRYLEGGVRYQSIQVADVGSHGIASGQYLDRTILTAVTFLLEHAWPKLSIPLAMSIDNAFAKTTHPNNPFTNWVRLCLFFGVEVIVGPPARHGWTNYIEAVNNEWQNRTIKAVHYNNLNELRQGSNRAVDWLNTCRPMHDPDLDGTRYPADYIASYTNTLRWPPDITIADHLNRKGNLTLPVSNGRITFVRHVTDRNTIKVALTHWPVPDSIPIGGLVTATITTGNRQLEIRHQGEPITRFDYPIQHTIKNPYHQPTHRSLLHHV